MGEIVQSCFSKLIEWMVSMQELQQHTANMVNSCICVSVQRDTQKQTRSDTQKRRSEVKAQMLQTGIVVALCGCMQEGSTKVSPTQPLHMP